MEGHMRLPRAVCIVGIAMLALAGVVVRAHATEVSCLPTVEGPIAVTADCNPYIPTAAQGPLPVPRGYVTEEFFISCTALGQPYRTRLFLRRPEHPPSFPAR